VWAYRVDEYRNGVKIGSVTRDIQLVIFPGTDQLPTLSGINQYPGSVTTICAGDSLMFDIFSADPDSGDSTFIAWHHFGQPNYTLTINGGQNEGASFAWATDSTMISPNPYLLYVSVKDNACPYYGLQTYVYKIFVNQCITNDVWPGDANSDLVCNMYDILPIGLTYGNTGPTRTGASLNWLAQPALAWNNTIASGVNNKHADCDGNGVIDSLDLIAITLNYGSTHNKMGNLVEPHINGLPDLKVTYSAQQVAPGAPVVATIELGNASTPLNAVYGIAYTLNYSVNMFQLGTAGFSNTNSFVGNTNNALRLTEGVIDYGSITTGLVRIDHNNASGYGEIGKFTFTANPLIIGDVTFNMTFSNVRLVMNDGTQVPVNVINNNSFTISQLLGVADLSNQIQHLSIRPNQTKDIATVSYQLGTTTNVTLEIMDMLGNIVQTEKYGNVSAGVQQVVLNIAGLNQGAYLVRVSSANGIATQRLIKL
ncbi:MAG TPA: T9SS type A sorting domain-containing protein, partial [Bacteroidia bacterium]|nr:T9SS type A sorting domain-containing protein [Bacteroidia bacterium]